MLRKCSLSIFPTAQPVKFIEAIDAEAVAAVETSEIPPPSATVAVVVAITCPAAHGY